jgi:hypothetical protein
MSRILVTSGVPSRRRLLSGAASGLAGILALGRAPAFSQTAPKKLVMAHIVALARGGIEAARKRAMAFPARRQPC